MDSSLICRACLTTISLEYIDLETPIYESTTFLDCFKFCTKLQAHLDDELPNNICVTCGKSLQVAYEFIKASIEADRALRDSLSRFGDLYHLDKTTNLDSMMIKKEEDNCEKQELEFHTISEDDYYYMEIKEEKDKQQEFPAFEVVISNEKPDAGGGYDMWLSANDDDGTLSDVKLENDQIDEDSYKSCTICTKKIHEDEYEGHINMHRGQKPYNCDKCDEKFFCKKRMEIHKKSKHKKNRRQDTYVCGWCGETFDLRSKLCQHRLVDHHGKVPTSCLTCGEECSDETSLRRHVKKEHGTTKKPVLCTYCNKEYKGISLHIKNSHPDVLRIPLPEGGYAELSPNQCPYCYRYFQSKTSLNYHMNTHTGERPYSCSICGKKFHNKIICDRHERAVHQSKDAPKMKCDCCDFTSSNIHSLRSHMQRHFKPTEKKYLCSFCPVRFINPKMLYIHEEFKHRNGKKKYECDVCQKKFAMKRKLKDHKLCVHVNGRPYACSECNKTFKNDFQLKAHEKLHLERDIDCPQCEKKFARQADLKIHMRTHTGELPYECHLCDKRYAIKVRLTYHLQKHMGVMHKCQHCSSEFNSRSKLRMHLFKHIGMPYNCDTCNLGFPSRVGARRHAKSTHKIILSDEDLMENRRKNEKNMLKDVQSTSILILPNKSSLDDEIEM